jgi:hypothetical protein
VVGVHARARERQAGLQWWEVDSDDVSRWRSTSPWCNARLTPTDSPSDFERRLLGFQSHYEQVTRYSTFSMAIHAMRSPLNDGQAQRYTFAFAQGRLMLGKYVTELTVQST